jgi:hypothetical protein
MWSHVKTLNNIRIVAAYLLSNWECGVCTFCAEFTLNKCGYRSMTKTITNILGPFKLCSFCIGLTFELRNFDGLMGVIFHIFMV